MMKIPIKWMLFLGILSITIKVHTQAGKFVLKSVSVVDVEKGVVKGGLKNVFIENGRISRITNTDQNEQFLQNYEVVDARGKYLLPGFWDMHAHPDDPEMWRMQPDAESRDLLLPLFVLHGVTGIRDMAGSMEVVKAWRDKIESGKLLGPKIVACGPLIDGPNPMWDGSVGISNLSRVKPVVDSLVASGSDFLKVYSLLPDSTYFELSKYAKKINMPFVGHVPLSVTTEEAARTGMRSQEHLLNLLIDCSDVADKIYDKTLDYGELEDSFSRYLFRNKMILVNYNQTKAEKLFKIFAEEGTWHTPTISMWYKNAYWETEVQKDSTYYAYLPGYMQKYWSPDVNDHLQRRDPKIIELKQQQVGAYNALIKQMNEAGVKLLAGTDVGANPLCFPGRSLHTELALLVESGLSAAEALRTATIYPAQFLEIEEDYGTVEIGKRADLVLLDENPLESIQNSTSIFGVIRDGNYIDAADIQKRLAEIRHFHSK